MKLKRYMQFTGKSDEVNRYLSTTVSNCIDELWFLLQQVDFVDNFAAQKYEVTVSQASEIVLDHALGVAPRYHLVLNGIAGVIRGSVWTKTQVSFKLDSDVYGAVSKDVILILYK